MFWQPGRLEAAWDGARESTSHAGVLKSMRAGGGQRRNARVWTAAPGVEHRSPAPLTRQLALLLLEAVQLAQLLRLRDVQVVDLAGGGGGTGGGTGST